jgi:hypothetical protein
MKYLRLLPVVALLSLGTALYAGDKAKDECKDDKACATACCKDKEAKAEKAACCKDKAEKKDSAKKPE